MKKNHLLKLTKYLTGAGAVLLATGANAEIIYTDLDPDSVRLGNNNGMDEDFTIDLDNDGNIDFRLFMHNIDTITYGPFNKVNDYYFNAVGYSEDGIVHENLQNTLPKIYNIDKRFGKLYTQTHDVKGTGLKESIENNNYRITKFLK